MSKKLGGETVMKMITVYHGGTEPVKHPLCKLGRAHLDFGQGFYLTDIRRQAEAWAAITAGRRNMKPMLNIYLLDRETILKEARYKIFKAYDIEWLEFIVASRQGHNVAEKYDYIEGGIADDRVIDTVNLYMAGLMDVNTALTRLSMHSPNNQICILNQDIADKHLTYYGTEQL